MTAIHLNVIEDQDLIYTLRCVETNPDCFASKELFFQFLRQRRPDLEKGDDRVGP
jgi:hypothetical protein